MNVFDFISLMLFYSLPACDRRYFGCLNMANEVVKPYRLAMAVGWGTYRGAKSLGEVTDGGGTDRGANFGCVFDAVAIRIRRGGLLLWTRKQRFLENTPHLSSFILILPHYSSLLLILGYLKLYPRNGV